MLIGGPREADLEPRIVSMGTCRVLRVKQVGAVFFVENMQARREVNASGKETVSEEWKIVAVVKNPKDTKLALQEAHQFLADANQKVLAMMQEDMRRARPV